MNELYKILEIDVFSDKEKIKKSYKKLSLKYHPDKNKDIDAKDKFIKIKEAYDILIDDEKRKIYDYQQKFHYFKDFDLNDNEINYLTHMYEKIMNYGEIKFIKILYNTLPPDIKNKMNIFSKNFFREDTKNDNHIDSQIVIPSKYINIESLNEDFILHLNIKIEDIYNHVLKKIIIHTKDFICYLFLRDFDDIILQNGRHKFMIKFTIQSRDYIKYKNHLVIHKKINIYELLFKNTYEIILPDSEIILLNKKKEINTYNYKNLGFYKNNKRGQCIIIFNLDYSQDFSKNHDTIKSIFHKN